MEIELKFALPAPEPRLLEKQLASTKVIGRRKPKREQLHNTYYDTPEHALQQACVALRVRQFGDANCPRWVQTLKMGGNSDSALSRRGEWEVALKENQLDSTPLANTPWMALDPDGSLFHALTPLFTTTFERLTWVIKRANTTVEVALDRGSVLMDGRTSALCELEIELLHGSTDVLFEIASDIAQQVTLLPLHMSKAERAYRLAQGTLDAPLQAKPPALPERPDCNQVAQTVLRECFLQFTANLNTLRSSDAPEVVHQARVGWRRMKSLLKLFKLPGEGSSMPSLEPLKPILTAMTELRDLDVAANEVLPRYATAYQEADATRTKQWRELEKALAQSSRAQRQQMRKILTDAVVGQTLLQITRWLETGIIFPAAEPSGAKNFSKWVNKRIARLAERVGNAPAQCIDEVRQHQLRIRSKRLRYCVESLRPLLPKRSTERWHQTATQSQTAIGESRDRWQAIAIAQRLNAADGIVQFLRGAAFGARVRCSD